MEVRGVQVVFKNATMLVSKYIDELLMESDILNAVGFSFAEFLEKNAKELDGKDMTHVNTESVMKEGTSGSLSKLAAFGGEERYEESSLLEVERAGVRRIKPVRMLSLPPATEGDPLDEEEPEIEIGVNPPEELDMAREQLVQKAVQAGLPMENEREMRDLVQEFADIFRIRLDDAEPAKVLKMTLNIKKEVRPTQAPPRQYNPRQKAFIETYWERLVKNKLAVKIPTSDRASPPFLVKKDPPHNFRFTLDLRGPNYATERREITMPNLEQKLAKLLGAKFFAKLDFAQGYWQLPLAWEAALVLAFRGGSWCQRVSWHFSTLSPDEHGRLHPRDCPTSGSFCVSPRRRYAVHVTLPWTLAATMLCRSVAADRCLADTDTAPSCVLSVAPYAKQNCAASVRRVDCVRTRKGGSTRDRPAHLDVASPDACEGAGRDWVAAEFDVTVLSCFSETRERIVILLASAQAAGDVAALAESRKTSTILNREAYVHELLRLNDDSP
jgi:hypothetical protein